MKQLDALQAALAGEHAAMYGVGVAGGKLTGARYQEATDLFGAHRNSRDQLSAMIVAAGQTPVAAEPAYDLPQAVTNAATATALVLLIERRIAAVYGDLVEAAEQGPVRQFAIDALQAAAGNQLVWGGAPVAFPGAL
ncbi:ferritin-like domain-containing protein [Kribbella sp.]|uniref:ferritin-like domain-containing protein n=1 Tax=Kribbella sp. TaxID=1871183 RepID=UPI002D3A26CA|nr:ferritin-like domain-containing protein [Kribbella sp.]HZX02359.1 ferritin-like domain-containing protein [Kribbella sp.]